MGMQRTSLSALLAAFVLFAGALQAQRGGGAFRGGAAGAGVGGPRGVSSGFVSGLPRFHNPRNFNPFYGPLWYDEPFGYEQPEFSSMPAPPILMMQPDKYQAAKREIPPASPQIIEVPSPANSAASKPLPPAVFILTNGQRLEARRYMLTQDRLYVTVDRQPRAIPLAMLAVNATLAANRARGIDLQIPADCSEISVGF